MLLSICIHTSKNYFFLIIRNLSSPPPLVVEYLLLSSNKQHGINYTLKQLQQYSSPVTD